MTCKKANAQLVFTILILCPIFSFAQIEKEKNIEDHDDKPLRMGISIGLNRSHYNILQSPQFLLFDSINVIESFNNTGINVGWQFNFRLKEHFDFRTCPSLILTEKALLYKLKTPDIFNKEDSNTIKKVEGISVSLPIQLKFKSDRIGNFKTYMLAGARVDYDLASNSGKKNITDVLVIKKLDFAAEAAIGFHFYFPVFLLTSEIKFSYGLKNMLSRETNYKYANTINDIRSRSVVFTLTFE